MWTESGPIHRRCATLLVEIASGEFGRIAPSSYETARLVVLAPWLAGHRERVEYLRRSQRRDGRWGGQDAYGLLPTLAGVVACLVELGRVGQAPRGGPHRRGDHRRLARAVVRGVTALSSWLGPGEPPRLPDTAGAAFMAPALLADLRNLVRRGHGDPFLADLPAAALDNLRLPPDADADLLERIRGRLAARDLPQRWWSCLDVLGPAAVANPSVHPHQGAVGCSPAATAAWLGGSSGDPHALAFLHTVQSHGHGPVPPISPVTYFEPAWVLNTMAVGGIEPPVPPPLLQRLAGALGPVGAAAAPGLPVGCHHTGAALSALIRHGLLHRPDRLLAFRSADGFADDLEGGAGSVSGNAQALEALALFLTHRPAAWSRFAEPAAAAAGWLRERQTDGHWWDRHHASPYYAVAVCVRALLLHDAARHRPAIDRAVAWLRDTQRPDGSWGRWQSTVEETAYAVQTLAKAAPTGEAGPAVAHGCRYLSAAPPTGNGTVPLWHGKDLFAPLAVVEAARLAALHLGGGAARVPTQFRANPAGTEQVPPVPGRDPDPG